MKSSDAGTYKVIFSDNAGYTTSTREATLTVAAPLAVITKQPTVKRLTVGDRLTLSATATGFTSWKWQKDGVDIPGATGTSSTIRYTKTKVSTSDAGTYKVILTNSDGIDAASSDATVTVSLAPTFSTQPADTTVSAGDALELTAAAANFVKWQWQKDGVDISGAEGSRSPIRFTKSSAVSGDAGEYKVILTNARGKVLESDSATVTVS